MNYFNRFFHLSLFVIMVFIGAFLLSYGCGGGAGAGSSENGTETTGGETEVEESSAGVIGFSTASYAVVEDAGTVDITILRQSGSDGAVSVQLTTVDGTAVADQNYRAQASEVSWADGDSDAKVVSIEILTAIGGGEDKAFVVQLSDPQGNATLGSPSSAVVVVSGSGSVVVLPSGVVTWVKEAGGDDEAATGAAGILGVAPLADGGSFVAGMFALTVVFGAGESNETSLTSRGSNDIFIAKYNADGTLDWAGQAGGAGIDYVYGIDLVDDESAFFIAGYFRGTATFGATEVTSAGNSDIFIAKYASDGTLEWVKTAGSTASDGAEGGVAVADDGTAFTCGSYAGTVVFGAGEANETSLTSEGLYDGFVAAYNSDGTLAWVNRIGGEIGGEELTVHAQCQGMTAMGDGDVFITGNFTDTVYFDASTWVAAYGGNDLYLARYSSNGALEWVSHAGGAGHAYGYGAAVMADGTSFVTGNFDGTVAFGTGEANEASITSNSPEDSIGDIFIARYNSDGTFEWVRQAGGDDATSSDVGQAIAVADDGTSFLVGSFYAIATFGAPGGDGPSYTSQGSNDIFIARYASDGTLEWVKQAGGPGTDAAMSAILLDDGGLLVGGGFSDGAVFFIDDPVATLSSGFSDLFLVRVD